MNAQPSPQPSAVSQSKGGNDAPANARAEFIAQATKHAALHLKSLDAVGKKAAEALKSIRYPKLAVSAAMENLGNSGMSRVIDDLNKQQKVWEGVLHSPSFQLAQEMIKTYKEQAERFGSWKPQEQYDVRFLAEPPYQHPLHPRDADRFDRIEQRLTELQLPQKDRASAAITPEAESDFTFDDKGLFLSFKGERLKLLTPLEIILCHNIFSETIGYRFRTMELEEIIYPGDFAESNLIQDRLKKLVTRLNAKIATQTGVKKFLLYTQDFVTRQV